MSHPGVAGVDIGTASVDGTGRSRRAVEGAVDERRSRVHGGGWTNQSTSCIILPIHPREKADPYVRPALLRVAESRWGRPERRGWWGRAW